VLLGNQPQGNLSGVETLALLSGNDTSYGYQGGGTFSYNLTARDGNVAAGQTLNVDGRGLQSGENVTFNGAAESDGSYLLQSGAGTDTLTAGGGADVLYGGGGADSLRGNAGADTFRYDATTDSVASGFDTIQDFAHALDRIDVSRIDAVSGTPGDDAFTFIGSAAFTAAGQLRAFDTGGGLWQIEGDVNGDGTADLVIQVHVDAAQPLTGADFIV
jgi:Ca2+-binding RTX toxin-like protein